MSLLDKFIERFNGFTEPYFFYNGTIELRYEPKGHVYYRIIDGEWVPQDGVTTVVHIIDKSDALIPWGCKMMAAKILAEIPVVTMPTGERFIYDLTYADFEKLILSAKSAHKEKLDDASNVGTAAHNWIEQYIKAVLAENELRKQELLAKFPEDVRAQNCCVAALTWMQRHNVRWICTERKIYSREFKYAGTLDGKAIVDSCDDITCCPHAFKDRYSLIDWKSSNQLNLEYILQTAAYAHADTEELGREFDDRWIIRLGKDDGEFDPWHIEGFIEEDFLAFRNALFLYRDMRWLRERMKGLADAIKAVKKDRAKKAKEEALKIKCAGADKYKGIRAPRCNGGNPCQTCLKKYQENHSDQSCSVTAPTAAATVEGSATAE